MIIALSNFFYLLFTDTTNHFSSITDIQGELMSVLSWLNALFFNFNGGNGTITNIDVDILGVLSVVLALTFVLGIGIYLLKVVCRLFTLRRVA